MKVELIAQGGPNGFSLAAALKSRLRQHAFDRLDVAVAYATLQGVKALRRILGSDPPRSRWLLGLDDAITQPEAIDNVRGLAGADHRVVKLSPSRRFHPKLYRLWCSTDPARSVVAIGSGNMTQRGLQENGEAAVLLQSETISEAQAAVEQFAELWALGHTPAPAELADYAETYRSAAARRRQSAAETSSPDEPAATDPVADLIPTGRTSENVIALAVARIAANAPDGVSTFAEARRLIPRMVALTPGDLVQSNSQSNAKWVQLLRNIKSNSEGGAGSTNFIALGYLEHVPGNGYRITEAGRAMLARLG